MTAIPPSTTSAVVCEQLAFAWPDGSLVLEGLDLTLGACRTGLIGDNGVGKSTLLRLIAEELAPSSGHLRVAGRCRYLPQRITSAAGARLADLLGITPVRRALARIEAGSLDQRDFDLVGDGWDVEARAVAELSAAGLAADESWLDRPVTSLSGGEAMVVVTHDEHLAQGLRVGRVWQLRRSAEGTLIEECLV